MLRALAQSRFSAVGYICHRNTARMLSFSAKAGPQEAAAAKSSSLRKFLMTVIPIGVIAAMVERANKGEEVQPATASASTAASNIDTSSSQGASHPKVTIHGGVTSHGVVIDPSNPLHKVLPETDCEFCLETREKLWGMMKGMKKAGGGSGTGGAGGKAKDSAELAAAPSPGAQTAAGAEAAPNPGVS